jgi:hypothetical protein
MNSTGRPSHGPVFSGAPAKAFGTKTYVVLQRQYRGPNDKRPNVKIIAVKLTYGAAESIKSATPSSWIERHDADKVHLRVHQEPQPELLAPIATDCTE